MHSNLRKIIVVAAFMPILVGCAADPAMNPPPPAGGAEADKGGFSAHEMPRLDVDVRADFDAALKYLSAGQYDKGIELLHKVAQRSPGRSAPYVNLAVAYQKVGNLPAAEENVKKALELDPTHPVANTEYGVIARKTGKFAEARKIYEQTLKWYPDLLPARKNLGILCDVYLRDPECALTHYRAYSAGAPNDKMVQLWIADLEKRRAQ